MTRSHAFFGLAMLALATPAAASIPDCPLARAPFSVDSPLIDLLLSARARAALDEAGVLKTLPPFVSGTNTPSFGTILSLRMAAENGGIPVATVATLDPKLRALPVTTADRIARCARYDSSAPRLSLPTHRPAILLFGRVVGFVHTDALKAARSAVSAMAARRGWAVRFTDRPGAFSPAVLRHFDAVVWNNVSGDTLTVRQRAALRRFVERGGGFVGFHGSSGDPLMLWDWYADTLIGARFAGHPMTPQFQEARLQVADGGSPITAGLGHGWSLTDEWYSFKKSPRLSGSHILVTIDERSYAPGALAMGDHPIAWTRCVGEGRSFYSAIGHLPVNYSEPDAARLLEQGIAWAAGLTAPTCRNGRELASAKGGARQASPPVRR